MTYSPVQYYFGLLRQTVKLQLIFLLLLSLSRLLFFWQFSPPKTSFPGRELAEAFFLGLRIDLVLVCYLMALPLLVIILNHLARNVVPLPWLPRLFRGYFTAVYLIVSALVGIDFGFYSYFGEHITIMLFGFFDDDTRALVQIGLKNYNVTLIIGVILFYALALVWLVGRFFRDVRPSAAKTGPMRAAAVYLVLLLLVGVGARGSLGLFPLLKDVPEVSTDVFVNAIPRSGVFAFDKALKQYLKDKNGGYDLIKRSGYKGRVPQAFRDYLGRDQINTADLASNLLRTTQPNEAAAAKPPHVVVVMVESFGAPILQYQSPTFDILRRLKRHFDEDILFTNFISGGNGTIASMEPFLLNVVARPGSIAYGQSRYQRTAFPQAAARIYKKAGYETNFVYGGDLSWRNVGSFFKEQGFDHVEGKSDIERLFPGAEEHDYGVYDRYTYDFVLQKLEQATTPQFVFILTTNNHPPYVLSKSYDSKPLEFTEKLQAHITGDMDLAHRRLQDYQYALDMAGRFMDGVKASALAEQTVVAITADNNTIEGIMHYDHPLQEGKQIPFYLYLPPYLRVEPFDRNVSASHNDLFPTLYGRTLSKTAYTAVGEDLYDPNALHCGYNDAGVVVSSGGAFKTGHAANEQQRDCEQKYNAALAVTEYLVRQAHEQAKPVWEKGSE
ncbi:LTA synthase family protein [Sulfurimonas sp. HSL-3221]|uniref:LTA synthase family protein n=1 Tax=Thiomicrolovo sulfuroxydans TaxID=2894755 RepID=UPI001E2BC298|nr:LTA synthase family protein [Sulfurimonas sp. HSL-3221]UFS62200.1 LTA synthase family protein [Sulfurimonas sp. HSL-3221]